MSQVAQEIAILYKDHAARLLAALVRIFGPQHFPLAEDVLQEAFSKALDQWQQAIPENPLAWIMQTAKNKAIDALRATQRKQELLDQKAEPTYSLSDPDGDLALAEDQIRDDLLRMMFMCCHAETKPENRIPLILKTLCGFSIPAISRALLLPVPTIKKRLFRTRERLKSQPFALPPGDQLEKAMETVHTILYLLFQEGYYSSHKRHPLNRQLCEEAIGLVKLLMDEPNIVNQETLGLYALLHFQMGRIDTRVDEQGNTIPINLQDRELWQHDLFDIACGALKVAQAVNSTSSGRFMIEAMIAKEHCLATSFQTTQWQVIVALYRALVAINQSPVAELNLAIALGYAGQVTQAIDLANTLCDHAVFKQSHMPMAALAHFHAMLGDRQQALVLAEIAQAKGGTPHEHQTMMLQLERLLASSNH